MLRDRLPVYADMALRYCKCKNMWIDHVYDNFVYIFSKKTLRESSAKICLGIYKTNGKEKQNFIFHNTIDWDNLDNDQTEAWLNVEGWVNYFNDNLIMLQQAMQLEERYGHKLSILEKAFIIRQKLPSQCENDPLVKFLVKNLKY